jgi:hypothetical protein
MNAATSELAQRINELLPVLQRDLEHIEQSIQRLDELRALVIKRDDSGLCRLLEQIGSQSQECVKNQKLREQLREQIAVILDRPLEQVRLGRLQQILPEPQSIQVAQMRQRLVKMVARLRTEHAATTLLLADLARFNGMLLKWILETGQVCGTTYDCRGETSRSRDTALVNLQF